MNIQFKDGKYETSNQDEIDILRGVERATQGLILPSKEFWNSFKKTSGAMSTAEGLALIKVAYQAPEGIYLELGSHKGKSSHCVALVVSKIYERGTFVAVEPEFDDENWIANFVAVIGSMLPKSGFAYHINESLDVIPLYNEYAFVFIDSGTHSDDLVMNETKMLEDKIMKDGIICYHDKGSQFTKVDEAYNYLLSTGKYEEITIPWQEIFDYVAEHDLEEGNNSWHLYPDLPHPPNFVGALRRK